MYCTRWDILFECQSITVCQYDMNIFNLSPLIFTIHFKPQHRKQKPIQTKTRSTSGPCPQSNSNRSTIWHCCFLFLKGKQILSNLINLCLVGGLSFSSTVTSFYMARYAKILLWKTYLANNHHSFRYIYLSGKHCGFTLFFSFYSNECHFWVTRHATKTWPLT